MLKKRTVPAQTVGYLLLWSGIILLLGRLCVFMVSLGNVVSPPVTSTPPQPGLTSASVENGMVYFTAENRMYALRASDGKQIWQRFDNFSGPPTIVNGMIYEISFRDIVALRASDGVSLWNYFPSDEGDAAQPGSTQIEQITADRIYVYDGQVLDVLTAESGGRIWSAGDAVNIVDINTLNISNGVVYYATHDKSNSNSTIFARRALDGTIFWKYSASVAGQSCIVTSMAQAMNILYASASCNNGTGRTFALRTSDGNLLWQSSMSGQFSVTNGVLCLHITQGSAALADLYVLQASTGKLLWHDAPGTSQRQTQVWTPGNGYVYLLDNGTLSARRLSDGQAAWNMGFSSPATAQTFETFSTPVFWGLLNNIVYLQSSIVNQDTHVAFNRLYALQANTGKQIWSFQQDRSDLTWTSVNIDAATGTIAIQGLDAQHPTDLYLLHATGGELLGSMIQSQAANTILMVNGLIYVTSTTGDGNNTPFKYSVRVLHADNAGDKTLWEFGA
ncbi:MAG TPA: PQQ-binding-like beta-propeller repeat protein [Ktedonobacteraceae bacterium]|nr:PQQ-binding-like beta-propeller repeat protein [Ktedonobacteraceae bacterium]